MDGKESLTLAAQQLRISYERARRLLLCGRLDGNLEDGRWFVTAESVQRVKREREAAAA